MPTVQLTDDPRVQASCRPLEALQQTVSRVYFATKEVTEKVELDPKGTDEIVIDHITKPNETIAKIAKQHGVPESKVKRTKSGPWLYIGEVIKVTKPAKKTKEVKFTEVKKAMLSSELYLIAETAHLQGEKVLFNILQGGEDCLAEKDKPIKVQFDDKDTVLIEAVIGEFADDEITNVDDFCDLGVAKITLAPKDEDLLKKWTEGLAKSSSKSTKLYVLADVHSEHSMSDFQSIYIDYKGFKSGADDSNVPNHFMNEDGAWFEVATSNCFCNRDLTVDETTEIIKKLRDSENVKSYTIWDAKNCELPVEDKTIERFTEQMNETFSKYNINTCLRKAHFLAQVYLETGRFKTTKEYATNVRYAPYVGRGLMQLTWEANYKLYEEYSGVKCVKDYELIANNLLNAFDSAGWYWKQGKKLSVGERWKASSKAPSYITVHKPDYPKDTIEYTVDGVKKKYGTVDFNLIADNDTVDVISWLVNGGSNGLEKRQNYLKTIKKIFNYPGECVQKGGGGGSSSDDDRAPWMKTAIEEAKAGKGVSEGTEPMYSMVQKYHTYVGIKDDPTTTKVENDPSNVAWCASFVSWVLNEAGNSSAKTAASRKYLTSSAMKKVDDASYGAVAVFSDCDKDGNTFSTGHVAFVYGKKSDTELLLLGGNQGNKLKVSQYDCSGNVFKSYTDSKGVVHYKKLRGFYVPNDYEVTDADTLTDDDKYTSATEANKAVMNVEISASTNGESSR